MIILFHKKFLKFYKNESNANKNFPIMILGYEPKGLHYQHLIYNTSILNNNNPNINNNIISTEESYNTNNLKINNTNLTLNGINKNKTNNISKNLEKDIEILINKYKNLSLKNIHFENIIKLIIYY